MTTPPGVAAAWARNLLGDLDPAKGPVGWLMREDGSQVCWGHHAFDIWDNNALRCPCHCHLEPPAVGHPWQPQPDPTPTGPAAWPPPRQAPPPRAVPDGTQLAIDTPEGES